VRQRRVVANGELFQVGPSKVYGNGLAVTACEPSGFKLRQKVDVLFSESGHGRWYCQIVKSLWKFADSSAKNVIENLSG
jgi:hypothetical protein